MSELFGEFFITTSSIILSATGFLKILAVAMDNSKSILMDPLFRLNTNYVMVGAAIIEFLTVICLNILNTKISKALLLIWLTGNFVLYRIGLKLISWDDSCRCLGNAINIIPVARQTMDGLSLAILVYISVGAVLIYVFERIKEKRNSS